MAQNIFPQDEDFQRKLFTDKKFLNRMKNVARHQNIEAGFFVEVHPLNGKYHISKVYRGNSEELHYWDESDSLTNFEHLGKQSYFNLHTHGKVERIVPSIWPKGDLRSTFKEEQRILRDTGVDFRIIESVTRYTSEERKPILLVQRKVALPSEDIFDEIAFELRSEMKNKGEEEIAKILDESLIYKADIIHFGKDGFEEEELKKLAKFAYVPIIQDKKILQEIIGGLIITQ